MLPTEILSSEHRVIEQVLDCLEKIVEASQTTGRLDTESAEQAIDFLRMFADQCHHGKEELHLFPAMEAKGFQREGGPTGVMLYEHEQGRACVRGMASALAAARSGDPAAPAAFVAHATRYVALLRQHIEKEDHCLFPMANQAFGPEDQARLLAAFQRVEREEMGPGAHEKYLAMADALAVRFGVQKAEARSGGVSCCGP